MSFTSRAVPARRVALITAFSVVVAGLSLGGAAGVAAADDPTTYLITGPDWASALTQLHSDASSETDGDTIELEVDVDVPIEHLQSVAFSHSTTLELNGHVLNINQITIGGGKTLTINDSPGGGSITTDADDFNSPAPGIEVDSGESLVINGGTIRANGATQAHNGPGIGSGSGNAGSVTINGGNVYANAGNLGAGIGGSNGHSGGSFTMTGGTVHATGAGGGAGIGGGSGANGGSVSITGGTVSATGGAWGAGIGGGSGYGGSGSGSGAISITGGTVTAVGGSNSGISASAIGAGLPSNSVPAGSVSIGSGADVTLSQSSPSSTDSVVDVAHSSLEIAGTVHVPAGNNFLVASGATATIDSTGVLAGDGLVGGSGTLANGGVITNSSVSDVATGGSLTITGNDNLVNFNPSSPNAGDGELGISERIYAPSFAAAGQSLPALPDEQGEIGQGWGASPDAGEFFTSTTPFSDATTTLYGLWDAVTSISIVLQSPSFTAGGNTTYSVIGSGSESESSDQTHWATVTSDTSSDVVDGTAHTVTATKAGTHTIHASLESLAGNPTQTNLAFLDVTASDAGVPPVLEFLDAPATAYPGVYFNYTLASTDAYGNPVAAVSTKLKSNVKSDTVKGAAVKFSKVGSHTITATSGSVTKTVTTDVILDTATIDLTAPSTQTAGQTKSVSVHLTPGLSGVTPLGKIRVYYGSKYVSATITKASAVTVKLPKFTKVGSYELQVKYYGSATYAVELGDDAGYEVTPAAVSKLAFEATSSKGYFGTFPIYANEVDVYGNVVNSHVPYTLTATGAGASVATDDPSGPILTLANRGKVTLRGVDGKLVATRKLTVVKDTPSIGNLPASSYVSGSSAAGDIFVNFATPNSNVQLTGNVELHFGTHTIPGTAVAHSVAGVILYTLEYDLSGFPAGKYKTYLTYPGDSHYNAVKTKTKTVTLVAGT